MGPDVLLAALELESNPDAPGVVMTLTGAGIAVFLLLLFNWVVGHALTVAHEGGHALMTVLLGGKVESVTTKSDLTGLTISSHPKGWGRLDGAMLSASGYIAPPLFGLAAAVALGHGKPLVVLWTTIVLLAILLPSSRNLFSFFTIVTFGTIMVLVAVRGDSQFQLISATAWTWLLLAGGLFTLIDHFEQGSDFSDISENWLGPMFFAIVYTLLTLVIIVEAGLILVGAKEPWI